MPKSVSDGYERLGDVAAEAKKETATVAGVVQQVIENYAELKNLFGDFYTEHMKNVPQHVHHVFNDLVTLGQSTREDGSKLVENLSDMSDPVVSAGPHVSKLFANAAVFLVLSAISSFIGSYVFSPLFGVIFLKFGAVLIATFLIPFITYYFYFHLKVRSLSDNKKRIVCATFVFEQSLLIGFINQDDWLDTPFVVAHQIVASFVFPMMLAHTTQRDKILGAVFGSCMLFHLAQGVISASLSVGFLVIALLYTILAIAFIQYVVAYRTRPDLEEMHATTQYVLAVSLVKMFSLMALGSTVKPQ